MKSFIMILLIVVSTHLLAQNLGVDSRLKDLDGNLPGDSSTLFALEKVSTPLTDWGITISPDCKEIYYTASIKNKTKLTCIVFIEWKQGKWSEPEIASFSGDYDDVTPNFSSDGKKIIFLSKRPAEKNDTSKTFNLWCVEKIKDRWGEPYLIKELYKTMPTIFFPFLAKNGDLYFNSSIPGKQNSTHVYYSKYVKGVYQKPEQLKGKIITEKGEYCPFVSPDQSWMIVELVDMADGFGGGDMYLSKREGDGSWGTPVNLGKEFNSNKHDCYPILSPGGKFLIFMSCRTPYFFNEKGKINYRQLRWQSSTYNDEPFDIYWISAKSLEKFIKGEKK